MESKNSTPKRWFKLDNAAKIYPAASRRSWNALFRLSATLSEEIDPEILAKAQEAILPRFPTFSSRLRHGFFWYYLEQNDASPEIQQDFANPCVPMNLKKNKRFMFRIRYHGKRIAVEFFHVLSDGTGGLIFLKTLIAEYLRLRYGADIPRGNGIFDCSEEAKPEELEDAFLKFARGRGKSRREADSFFLKGTDEKHDFINITTGIIPVSELLQRAKELGVSLTEYLTAVMILSLDSIQRKRRKKGRSLKPIKICVPINLRKLYPTNTVRNFASYANPGIEPSLGKFSLEEVARTVHHQMHLELNEKQLNAKFSTNVNSEKNPILRIAPLFIKNAAMKFVFYTVGDRKTSSSISNLGAVSLPAEMERYVERMDFILGPLSRTRVVCGVLSYKDKLYINFTRSIKESVLEREFFSRLVKSGIHVKIESNLFSKED